MRSTCNGTAPFEEKIDKVTLKEIARHPDNLFDYWICKEFKVLPSSPDFQNLTQLQKDMLYEQYLAFNPEIAKQHERKAVQQDEEFDEIWEAEETPEVIADNSVVVESSFDDFAEDAGLAEENIPYSDAAKNILARIEKKLSESGERTETQLSVEDNDDDWEEVDD